MDFPQRLEDNEDEEEQENMYGTRDGLIFLVDSTEPMFVTTENEERSPFETSMECCKTFMLSKIISSDRDVISIVLFGTAKSANELSAPNITTLQNLSEPSAEKIKQLETMLKPGGLDDFVRDHGHSNNFALSDALWLCQIIFATSPLRLGTKRVLLVTCTSDPHVGDVTRRGQAMVRAADLAEEGVQLELLHLGDDFDTQPFYQELACLAAGDPELVLPDPTLQIEELLERVCRLNHQKRALCHLDWELGPTGGATLAVQLYNLVRKTPLPKKCLLDRNSNEPVTMVTRYINPVTDEVMLPAELLKSQMIAERQVRLRFDEVRELRSMVTKPGLRLLGFKPSSRFKPQQHVKPSAFLFPDDSTVKGSRHLFSALLDRCLSRAVVPLCYLTERANATPKLVSLHPQAELRSRDGRTQRQPAGFHVVYQPYAESVRTVPLPDNPRAGMHQVALASAALDSLRIRYRPSLLDNPRLQTHWANVEALALGHDAPRDVTDYTRPNHAMMAEKLGSKAVEFLSAAYQPQYDPAQGPARAVAFKREASAGKGPPAKAANITVDHSYVVTLHREGKLSRLNISQLKGYLDNEHVAYGKSAKKADLIEHVQAYLK